MGIRPFVVAFTLLTVLALPREAPADYDATLNVQPRNPWALYGRGIARVHEGMETEGRADIAASRASGPGIVALAERLGIKP